MSNKTINSNEAAQTTATKLPPSNRISNKVIFDQHGCMPLLRKYPQLKSSITHAIITQLENNLFKSKFATKNRWHGLPIRECRVNANEPGAVRVAFVIDGNTTTVIYLSRTLQKRAFTTELDRFLGKKSS